MTGSLVAAAKAADALVNQQRGVTGVRYGWHADRGQGKRRTTAVAGQAHRPTQRANGAEAEAAAASQRQHAAQQQQQHGWQQRSSQNAEQQQNRQQRSEQDAATVTAGATTSAAVGVHVGLQHTSGSSAAVAGTSRNGSSKRGKGGPGQPRDCKMCALLLGKVEPLAGKHKQKCSLQLEAAKAKKATNQDDVIAAQRKVIELVLRAGHEANLASTSNQPGVAPSTWRNWFKDRDDRLGPYNLVAEVKRQLQH